ncbi:MAG: FAD-dependent oxidoreductase [Shimia sp.]
MTAPAPLVGANYRLAYELYPYRRVPAQGAAPARHPVVVIGAGPVGLATALDLGRRGTPVLVLDDHDGAGQGSRAICFAQRTLQIAERLGVGHRMTDKGVVWNVGRVFHGDDTVFSFDLLPEAGHRHPAFVNLQQPYVEKFLVEAIEAARAEGAPIEIRGRNVVSGVTPRDTHVALTVDTPDGPYGIEADWVMACDGARSPTREALGLAFDGRVFEDNFLIADVRMQADFPTERWFWFDPPFEGAGASALLHKQPDDVWRIDFQLGWDIDRAAELDEARVRARVDAMLGPGVAYDLVWTSIYTFQCRRMERFRHGRVLFAGDAAHQVSPFGARGANSGIQDAENLAWKLHAVVRGKAGEGLLDTYATERAAAADENILHSTRATDFLTPKAPAAQLFRDAVLALARDHPFARPLINSGRLSTPYTYDGSPLAGPDALPGGPTRTRPGSPCPDAPLGAGWLLDRLAGETCLLALGHGAPDTDLPVTHVPDPGPELRERYLGTASSALYLIRPDQHVVARWAEADAEVVAAAAALLSAGRPWH